MKNIIALSILAVSLGVASAQTNTVASTNAATLSLDKSADEKSGMPMELTFGGSGVTNPRNGSTQFGFDVSLSLQPTKLPIWVGISQELAWSPSLEGATDFDIAPTVALIKDKLYLDYGWSVGAVYDRTTIGWRTGPELELEYYTKGNVFIFAGINYDLLTKDTAGWHLAEKSGLNNLRYDFGIGWAF